MLYWRTEFRRNAGSLVACSDTSHCSAPKLFSARRRCAVYHCMRKVGRLKHLGVWRVSHLCDEGRPERFQVKRASGVVLGIVKFVEALATPACIQLELDTNCFNRFETSIIVGTECCQVRSWCSSKCYQVRRTDTPFPEHERHRNPDVSEMDLMQLAIIVSNVFAYLQCQLNCYFALQDNSSNNLPERTTMQRNIF